MNWDYLSTLNFSAVWTYRDPLIRGFGVTLMLTAISTMLGIAAGTILAAISQAKLRPLRWCVAIYVELWRNTPLLVQAIWIHFALPLLTHINTTALQSGLIALSLNVTAYFTEIIRAGIEGVDKGQWEAAHALGLPRWPTWRFVVLPQAIRIVVPPLANLVISLFKATAILSVLSINDLMRITVSISNYTFKPIELLSSAAIVYFLTGLLMTRVASQIERHYRKSERK
jgi:His/Glu/Gln/Arg/opine family amino acid ABC transporter permease subunit